MRKVLAVLFACLAVLGGPAAYAAGQMRADDPPAVEGQFYDPPDQQCDEQTLRSGGKAVIKVAFCIFFYGFDPLYELDLENDYGVVWAQATFDALPGYCTSELSFYVEMPDGTAIHGRTPPEPIRTRKRTPALVSVSATAGDTAIVPGRISQELQLLPGKMAPTGDENEPKVGVAWKGRTPAKLAFATGAEVSWPWLESPPPIRLGADTIRLTSGKGC
ncbi:MAG TPA: hypothetical protein VHN37_07145 [Actinomycetota bacterium]|nr:hypothetical protein [Actinomycetota bacterium]